jgi:2-haloacid dehalogenase
MSAQPEKPMVEAVLFDIGGIFLDWDPRHLYRKVFEDEERMEWFLEHICTATWHMAHDQGSPMAPSCAELARHHPEWAVEITAWSDRSEEMVGGIMDDAISVLAELTATGMPCYALTNMEAETYPRRVARYEFFSLFDGIVVSGIEGTAKPNPAIFHIVVDRFGLAPAHTLFVDDRLENVGVARSCGFLVHHYHGSKSLRATLEGLQLLPG